jgi:hypothetical protein
MPVFVNWGVRESRTMLKVHVRMPTPRFFTSLTASVPSAPMNTFVLITSLMEARRSKFFEIVSYLKAR